MRDTSKAVRSEYYRRIAELSPAERGDILAATVHDVRKILWTRLQHLPEYERRVAFLQRMYGRELSAECIRRVAGVSSGAATT